MLKLNPEERLFIDGALVAAEDGQTYNVINPTSEEVAGVVAAPSLGDADRTRTASARADEDDCSAGVSAGQTTVKLRRLISFRLICLVPGVAPRLRQAPCLAGAVDPR
jgi:hypothetical protein